MEQSLGVRTIEPLPRFLVPNIRSFSRSSNMPFGPVRAAEQNSSFTSSQPWIPWNCHENRAFAKLNNPFCVDFVFLSIRCHKILLTAKAQCISTSSNIAPLLLRKPSLNLHPSGTCELPVQLSPPRRVVPHRFTASPRRRVTRASTASYY